ncbi:MAG: MaoC family dehydratase N-terminal domain-containing protein [Chloroflexota bacterium]|nr:MaoC family dehydratase N-terminal domain-containing protein [Dehalococcoidia bacterium]MDW8253355.1 MaoC family dehydratase N-terminal domain-containing protein [Chloroflexota bacterium]
MTAIEFDRTLLDRPIPVGTFTWDAQKIEEYLAATGEGAPPEDEFGPYAPPLMGMAFVGEPPPLDLQWGRRTFLAGQVFWPLVPIRPGDMITTTTFLRDVYEKTGRTGHLVFVVWETELTNQRGEVVARCRRTLVHQE